MARMQPKLSNNKKRQLQTLVEQANLACVNGRFDVCEQLCRRIESMQPGHANVANLRGIMCIQTGQTESAVQWLRQAVATAPRQGEFHNNLGKLYLDLERYAEAADSYRQAIKLGKKTLPVRLCYSKALLESGRLEEAVAVLQQLRKQQPGNTDVLMGLFSAAYHLNRIEEARSYLQAILDINPDHGDAHIKMAKLASEQGRMDEAEAEIRAGLRTQPDNIDAYATLAEIKKFADANDADIAAMTALYERSAATSFDRIVLSFVLGKAMEDLQEYDRAFEYFAEGNALRHKQSRYNADLELAHLQEIMQAYTPATFDNASDIDDATPVFIVGMPRCGSTLTEQILAAHPEVASKGEWGFFEAGLARFNSNEDPLTLEKIVSFTPGQWHEVGQFFLDRMKADHPDASRITDKSLDNIRLVGAIHCAMPKAKIVHVRRHPLDTCLSIYKHHLQSRQFDYGYNLGELGYYYRMYLRLMQHWRDVLPAGVMYELDYERLVANQEEETRKLLDYCGLDWNDQCLEFNKAKNIVRTASIAQVRRPMYTDSLAAWKRYEKHLQPLIRILGPEYSTDYKVRG